VARLWRDGEPYEAPDAVVAGAGMDPDSEAMLRLADSILGSAYGGDFAIALDRAAAFFRVIAAGAVRPARDGWCQRCRQPRRPGQPDSPDLARATIASLATSPPPQRPGGGHVALTLAPRAVADPDDTIAFVVHRAIACPQIGASRSGRPTAAPECLA